MEAPEVERVAAVVAEGIRKAVGREVGKEVVVTWGDASTILLVEVLGKVKAVAERATVAAVRAAAAAAAEVAVEEGWETGREAAEKAWAVVVEAAAVVRCGRQQLWRGKADRAWRCAEKKARMRKKGSGGGIKLEPVHV